MSDFVYMPGAELIEDMDLYLVVRRVSADSDKYAAQAAFTARFSNCLKNKVVALIVGPNGVVGVGYNGGGETPMDCPRMDVETGMAYNLCDSTCPGQMHAEVAAVRDAGLSRGTILYLSGHTYCCPDCIKVMEEYGIKEVRIVK